MTQWQDVLKKAEEFGWKWAIPADLILSTLSNEELLRVYIFSPEFLLAWAKFEMELDLQNPNKIRRYTKPNGYIFDMVHKLVRLSLQGKPYLDYFSQFLEKEDEKD